MLFKKKYIPKESEALVYEVIQDLLAHADTRIEVNPDDMSYMCINDSNHFYVFVDSVGIQITNTVFLTRNQYSANFLDLCKSAIKEKTIEDRNRKKEEIFQREIQMLENIQKSLKNN